MKRDHGVLILLLVVVLVFGLAPGMTHAYDDVKGESTDGNHTEWTDVRPNPMEDKPNPMERPTDLSAPVMKPGSTRLPAVQQGSSVAFTDSGTQGGSAPAMNPGSKLLPAVQQGGAVGFTDSGTQGTSLPAMRSGSAVAFTDAGTQGVSMGSGSSVGFTDSGTQGTSLPAVQSPGKVRMPGKMR